MKGKSVDWQYWRQIPRIQIWQAILLTLDCDPNEYDISSMLIGELIHKPIPWEDGTPKHLREFAMREHIACENVGDERFPETEDANSIRASGAKVRLDKFISWAIFNGWKMPDECSALQVRPVGTGAEKGELPNFHSNTTEALRSLCEASRKFWENVDPTDKTTYPHTPTVIEWLVKKGLSYSVAKSGATIIRPKWAATGRMPD
jgi:hypothetical protein